MSWFSIIKKSWNSGYPIADQYEDNQHSAPQSPTRGGGNRTIYDTFELGGNQRRPFSGNEKNPGVNISLTDPDRADKTNPNDGKDVIQPGNTILDSVGDEVVPNALLDHYHEDNRFVADEDLPRMTDDDLPKTIGTRLQGRVPIRLR